jgi:glutamyl-tRNA synthetase
MSQDIADLCFPDITTTRGDILACYPNRDQWQVVTRIAPSPTGVAHIGLLYNALIGMKFAHQNKGIFILRIEDTDQKRQIENGVEIIVGWLWYFGIHADEWPQQIENKDWTNDHKDKEKWSDHMIQIWQYGPYIQSERRNIYQTIAKDLIAQWLAYPCFLTSEEIEQIRSIQTIAKQLPGIYGDFATYRNKSYNEIKTLIDQWKSFVIRLLCPGKADERIVYDDLIKWRISAQANINDTVLIKSDGLTTYHFAHIVDDYLMWTTHAIRADERVPSVPLHIQLYDIIWWGTIRRSYAHLWPLLKLDQGNRRKLSKRKDPEADIMFFVEQGYPTDAILEYLTTIVDSKYEDYKKKYDGTSYTNYEIKLEQMNTAGALVDMDKVKDICKEYFASLSAESIYTQCHKYVLNLLSKYWTWDQDQDMINISAIMIAQKEYILQILNIERWDVHKDPKRFITYYDVISHIKPFVDTIFDNIEQSIQSPLPSDLIQEFVTTYANVFDLTGSKEQRFDQLKSIWSNLWYALTNQEYKTGTYKGKIGDLAMILRIALFKSAQTPDLYESMKVMGISRVQDRLNSYTQNSM